MAKSKYLTMRIDEATYTYLKEMAERDHRTLTNLISLILIKAVERDETEMEVENI